MYVVVNDASDEIINSISSNQKYNNKIEIRELHLKNEKLSFLCEIQNDLQCLRGIHQIKYILLRLYGQYGEDVYKHISEIAYSKYTDLHSQNKRMYILFDRIIRSDNF